MQSLYETFGNEVSYTVRRGKLVKFLQNSTVAFPIPEASVDILTSMLDPDQEGIEATRVDAVKARLTNIGFGELTTCSSYSINKDRKDARSTSYELF